VKAPHPLSILLEVGCEEIPARFLTQAQKDLGERLEAALRDARLLPDRSGTGDAKHGLAIKPSSLRTFSTPRRLVAWVPAVLERQPDVAQEILGPPVKVAVDAQGKPTRAAQSFAAKNNAAVRDLVRVTTPKGEYTALRKKTPGRPAKDVLPEALTLVTSGLSFPKSMYWEESKSRFIRPVRWIVALLGEGNQARVIPFEFAGVKSGDRTFGHRAMGEGSIRVVGFKDYAKKLRALHVEVYPAHRREAVRNQCKALLDKLSLTIVKDEPLEDWIANSTEWPTAILGSFDPRYLTLPREILVTVMRDHQKYFAVEDRKGTLQPRFVAVLNLEPDRQGVIRAGHQRVLTARFKDAEFFWQADQRVRFSNRVELLSGVTYQAELGTYAEKVRRMGIVASEVLTQLEAQGSAGAEEWRPVESERARRAVELAKCDLTTQMVKEFPELQGIVGGLYARAQGEQAEVPDAIYDQYLPQGLEDKCPRSAVGAVVSLADKIDSVAAGFAVGQAPSGSSDPFALRRQGNGIIKVLLELRLGIELKPTVERALNSLDIKWEKPREEVFKEVLDFLAERLRHYLETVRKLRYDTVRAVLAAGWDPPLEALKRAEALEALRHKPDFEAIAVAAKRIRNILAKSAKASDWTKGGVSVELLEEGPEGGLYTAFALQRDKAEERATAGEYGRALESIASLRPYVDRFFDKVLVMAPDSRVRENRLRLLASLDQLFSSLAHFAEMANVDASTS